MSEMAKTGIFAGLALLVSLGAVLTRPALPLAPESAVKLGEPLFAEYDPTKGASLEVVERKASGKVETFKVGKVDGQWVLTSYKNYPADAVSRLKDLASMLLGAKIIDVIQPDVGKDGKPVSEAEHQETYGVIAPDAKTTKDDKGIGQLITLRDKEGVKLASLIVGIKAEEVGAAPLGAPAKEKRFVRRDGESTVFVAEFDSSKLTTNYADWMEKDLLKQKTASGGQDSLSDKVERATLRDFAVGSTAPSPSPAQALSEIKLTWKQSDFKWHLDEVLERRGGELAAFTMLTSEELNTERLDDLKRALDDLKFVEVEPKPAGGLDANLRATPKLMQDQTAIDKLAAQGFLLRDGYITGSGGELVLLTKEGVEYVLRFGGTQNLPPAPGAKADDPVKQGRYLMLAARANTSIIPPPVFDPLPAADIGPAAPGAEPKEGPEAKEGASKEGKEAKEPKAADLAKKKAEREAIEKKNKRLQDEYDQKLKEAEKAVREFNFRFADWYYVVADEAYQKLHLTRADVVREKKDAKETGFEIDSFRDLEGGPKKKEAAPPPGPPGGFPHGGGFPGRPPF